MTCPGELEVETEQREQILDGSDSRADQTYVLNVEDEQKRRLLPQVTEIGKRPRRSKG